MLHRLVSNSLAQAIHLLRPTKVLGLQVPGAQDLVDFSPVYRCLHIYSVLSWGFLHVGQAGLELLTSGDPPTSASQSDGIT
ncbi:hypothetical protein AAY473_009855, partial [Plecturocebus cupreus]